MAGDTLMAEHTFYCPGIGVWVSVDDVPREILATYPEGTVEVGPKPGPGYNVDPAGKMWVFVGIPISELRAAKAAGIARKAGELLTAGAPVAGGLHVALDDGSRADLTAMAATATVAASGAVPWPESYARGWITIENVRIPLATPSAGLALAASVGNYYAALIQHRRDLKDAALAAENEAALDVLDISAGWPAS
jgi:hypothetical protein